MVNLFSGTDPSIVAIIRKAEQNLPTMDGSPLMVHPVVVDVLQKNLMLQAWVNWCYQYIPQTMSGENRRTDEFLLTVELFRESAGKIEHKRQEVSAIIGLYQGLGGSFPDTNGLFYLVALALLA